MFPPNPEDLVRDDGMMLIPARVSRALTKIITLGVEEGRRRGDPTINDDMCVLLDAIQNAARDSVSGTARTRSAKMDTTEAVLTAAEAADRLGCTTRKITHACNTGQLRATKFGKQWSIPMKAFDEYRYGENHAHRNQQARP